MCDICVADDQEKTISVCIDIRHQMCLTCYNGNVIAAIQNN